MGGMFVHAHFLIKELLLSKSVAQISYAKTCFDVTQIVWSDLMIKHINWYMLLSKQRNGMCLLKEYEGEKEYFGTRKGTLVCKDK